MKNQATIDDEELRESLISDDNSNLLLIVYNNWLNNDLGASVDNSDSSYDLSVNTTETLNELSN